jgi:DNA-binding NtrC family response regulator
MPEPEPIPEPEPLRETILIVDDEAGIRGLMRKILKREHYNVIEAANAEDALKEAAAHSGPIRLLLTDVMLPGLLGPELARKMYALDNSIKVLYISGYTQDERVRAGEYPPGARFLAKPFTLSALLEKVRETLDAPTIQ